MACEVTVRMEGLLGEILQGGALIEEAFTVVEGVPMTPEKLTQAQVACRNLRHAVEDLEALLWEGEHGAPRPWSMKREDG